MNCVWSFPGLFWPILANKKKTGFLGFPELNKWPIAGQTYQLWGSQKEVFKFLIIVPRSPKFTRIQTTTYLAGPSFSAFFFLVCGISYQIGTKIEKYKWNQTKTYGRMACCHFLRNCFFPARWKKKQDFGFWMNEWPTIFSREKKKRYLWVTPSIFIFISKIWQL